MAYLKDSFFELGMTHVSHPRCLVESDNNGTVVFEFGLDPAKQCLFTTELYKSLQDPALNTVEGGFTFDQFCTLENLQDKLRVTISFPRIGRYKFELDGKEVMIDWLYVFTAITLSVHSATVGDDARNFYLGDLGSCRGGATVLKVRGKICERSEQKIFFDPHFLASAGDKILLR